MKIGDESRKDEIIFVKYFAAYLLILFEYLTWSRASLLKVKIMRLRWKYHKIVFIMQCLYEGVEFFLKLLDTTALFGFTAVSWDKYKNWFHSIPVSYVCVTPGLEKNSAGIRRKIDRAYMF